MRVHMIDQYSLMILAAFVLVCPALAVISVSAVEGHQEFVIVFRGETSWPVASPGMIRPDGSSERYLDFKKPLQKSWQWGPRLFPTDGSWSPAWRPLTSRMERHFGPNQQLLPHHTVI